MQSPLPRTSAAAETTDIDRGAHKRMSSDSGIQDSIDKTREAFRRAPSSEGTIFAPSEHRRRDAGDDNHEERAAALRPFFRGLLDELPAPGADWSPATREQWLETARHIFALIYTDPLENRGGLRLVETPREQHQPDHPQQQSA